MAAALPGFLRILWPTFPAPSLIHPPLLFPLEKGRCWLESEGASGDRPRPPDSHQWGPVPLALVDGRALAVVWPPQRWAWLSGGSQPSRILAHGHAGPEDETWPYR